MDSGSPRSRIPDPDPEYPIPGILDQDARNELKNNMMPLNILYSGLGSGIRDQDRYQVSGSGYSGSGCNIHNTDYLEKTI